MVRDHPLTGVGPNMVQRVYPRYRVPGAVQPVNPHLHNVPMQIAAERGLPALAAWLWFVVALGARAVARLRPRAVAGAGGRPARGPGRRCSPPGCSNTTSATPSS